MQRERLGSRLGFILLSAGCAIGIGNVWKFPYMVGQNGGGAFVLIYLFFLLVLGIPVMTPLSFPWAVPAKRVLSVSISSWSLREANGTIMATLR